MTRAIKELRDRLWVAWAYLGLDKKDQQLACSFMRFLLAEHHNKIVIDKKWR